MVTASFIFHQIKRDADFERLDAAAAAAAESLPGYLDRKKWYDRDGNMSVVYYWESLEALEEFARHPAHLEAKARYTEWYSGYRIEIADVLRTYGDGYYDDSFPDPSIPGAGGGGG